jgi:hypothetical protein
MKNTRTVLVFISVLLLATSCHKAPSLGDANQTHSGTAYPADFRMSNVPPDGEWVAFGIITDTHIDASYAGYVPFHDHDYRGTHNVMRAREMIDCLNIDATNAGCHAVVHMGDMVDDNNTQNLIAFRQLFEKSYPGYDGGSIAGAPDDNYQAYSLGHRLVKELFPGVGNHDEPYYGDDPTDWRKANEHVWDRINNAPGLLSHYGNLAYAWCWGKYYFIQLGLWAGSCEHESNSDVDQKKLDWLKNLLDANVGNSNYGVIIFQHYGWDGFSTDGRWWTSHMRDLELNILCRRDSTHQPQPCAPSKRPCVYCFALMLERLT